MYLRSQNDAERDTPKWQVDAVRQCQRTMASQGNDVVVTLAGCKTQEGYRTILKKLYTDQRDTIVAEQYDVAAAINTSALDLAAAAGCVILRDREWKQGEYSGHYDKLFPLAATYTKVTMAYNGFGPSRVASPREQMIATRQ